MLQIRLDGYEPPHVLEASIAAMRTYVDTARELAPPPPALPDWVINGQPPAAPAALQVQQPIEPEVTTAPAAAAEPAVAEAPKETKSQAKRKAAQKQEPAPAETAEAAPAPRVVKIEDIRAVAARFNTDELREIAVSILTKHGATSVSGLAERDDDVRASVLEDLQAALPA